MDAISGTWRLRSFELESNDGHVLHPYGKDVSGLLILDQSGYMAEMIAGNRRKAVSTVDLNLMTDEEKIAVARDFNANSGRFELQEGTLIFHIEVSLLPALIGVSQKRFVRVDGNRLIFRAAPVILGERSLVATLTWEKVS